MFSLDNGLPGSSRTKTIVLVIVMLLLTGGIVRAATYSPSAPQPRAQEETDTKATSPGSKVAVRGKTALNTTTTEVPSSSDATPQTTSSKKSSSKKPKSTTTTKQTTTTKPVATTGGSTGGSTGKILDLFKYFPGTNLTGQYLEGMNYKPSQSRSVLWFEVKLFNNDGISFVTYNSDPKATTRRCHSDYMKWTAPNISGNVSPDGDLLYTETKDECNTSAQKPKTDIVYSPGIVQVPRMWDDTSRWSVNGSTNAIYSENGVVKCVGVNRYTNEILGYENLNGQRVIHWRTVQTTTWNSGPGSTYSGCAKGQVTKWEEHHYYGDSIPAPGGGTSTGLLRTVGGNKEINYPNWDVTFTRWENLPSTATQP